MNAQGFEQMCMQVVKELRALAPKDTGNLAYNAIQFEWVDNRTFKIFVNEEIASYMPFTNEPWLSPRWGGKKNPNEKWFNRASESVAVKAAQVVRGELKKHD